MACLGIVVSYRDPWNPFDDDAHQTNHTRARPDRRWQDQSLDQTGPPAQVVTAAAADSMQVYRHMDIGTAKPTAAEQAAAHYHLLDLVEPNEVFTVDDWLAAARPCIDSIRCIRAMADRTVGGTNLYVQALCGGFMQGPEPDPELRTELEATDRSDFEAELERIDPEAAEQIHPNDLRRTVRAIEVHRLSGQPLVGLAGAMGRRKQT